MDPQNAQSSTYKMRVRVDPVLWFQGHPLATGDVRNLEQLYKIVYDYAEKVKRDNEGSFEALDERHTNRVPISEPEKRWCPAEQKGHTCKHKEKDSCDFAHYVWCDEENRGNTGKCPALSSTLHSRNFKHTSQIDKSKKPVYQCRFLSTKLNRQQAFCLFHVNSESWLHEGEVNKPSIYPYFIVAARNDATPVITLNPVKHCSNDDYVVTSDAWQAVIQTLAHIKNQVKMDASPMSRIYVNFGRWMQQRVDDPSRLDAHAHINIVLTRRTIEKINDINRSKDNGRKGEKLFQSLVGSVRPPTAHRLDDALELIKHMNIHMIPVFMKQNLKLEGRVKNLEFKLKAMTEEFERFRNSICGSRHLGEELEERVVGSAAADIEDGINDDTLAGIQISDHGDE